MGTANDLQRAVDKIRRNSQLRQRLAGWLLATGIVLLVGLVYMVWFEMQLAAHAEEILVRLSESQTAVPDAFLIAHKLTLTLANMTWQAMICSMGVGALLGGGWAFKRAGRQEVLLDLWDRVEAIENRLERPAGPVDQAREDLKRDG